jgi:hypothetical protein
MQHMRTGWNLGKIAPVLWLCACSAGESPEQVPAPHDLRPGEGTRGRSSRSRELFPPELTEFVPYENNPVFGGAGAGHWDTSIRERGWILREESEWRLWYSGYDGTKRGKRSLGLAVSADGLSWTRAAAGPIYDVVWTEDVMVVKNDGHYWMFAEGKRGGIFATDEPHLLKSDDGLQWEEIGPLDIRHKDGSKLPWNPLYGSRGTPTVFVENGVWYLFCELLDQGAWLAKSTDGKAGRPMPEWTWTQVQDEPVIPLGPDAYDRGSLAVNQIVKYRGAYYAYYHGSPRPPGSQDHVWSINIAVSGDLIHWTKYAGNPIIEGNRSSGVLVDDGTGFRLYTMHGQVEVHRGQGHRR